MLTRRAFNLSMLLPLLSEACTGNGPAPSPSQVLVAGGASPLQSLARREIYVFDSGCGRFIEPPKMMTVPRMRHTASPIRLSDGRDAVLIAGGTDFQDTVWPSWEIVLPDGSPVQSGSMAVPRMGHTATRLTDGRVLICGGITNIAVQGRTTTATLTNTAEVFDPASFQSIPTDAAGGTTMTAYRLSHTGTLIENGPNGSFAGAVLIAGGSDSGPSAELFDPSSNGFAGTAALHGTEMQVRRSGHQATWLPGINLVLITGGAAPQSGGGVLAAAEIYNPGGGFIRIRDMNLPRVNHTATNIGLNVVLIAGGLTAPQRATDSAELWNPQSQAFTVVAHPMTRRRANHSAVLLSTGPRAGDVVIVGGLPTAADADLFHPADQTFMAEFPAGTFGPYNNTATLVMPTQPAQCP